MIHTCIRLFRNKDIRKKILFTLAMMFVFRLGAAIPAPRVNTDIMTVGITSNSILAMMNLLGGGAFERLSVFALGVGPYITASIIIQLLAMDVIPALTEMSKSGQQGRVKMDKITRYLAVVLAFVQAITMIYAYDNGALGVTGILVESNWANYFYVATVLTAGTMFLLWLADRITQFGIGNGVSMIIFAGIVSGMPSTFTQVWSTLVDTSSSAAMFGGILSFAMYVVMYVLIIVLVVFMQLAVRKIPIQYTSSNMHRGKNDITYLPLKINSAGVMPVIFSSAIMTAPLTIMSFFPANDFSTFLNNVLNMQKPLGLCIYAVLIVLFTFFYTNLQVDPEKIAENLGKSGTYIPGIRPGAETKAYLAKVLNRITVLGAAFILFIAMLPYLMTMFTNLTQSAALGGTGIIIVVGVATETFSALKGMLTQKQYRGFIQR